MSLRLPYISKGLERSGIQTASQPASSLAATASPVPLPVPPLETGQRNLLVIGVDHLGGVSQTDPHVAPRLESVWLLLYFVDRPQITLLPLYPSPTQGSSSSVDEKHVEVSSLSASFSLRSDHTPSPSFLQLLESQEIWWNHYILLDRTALSQLIEFAGASQKWNGESVLGKVPAASEDGQAALAGQSRIAQDFCRLSAGLGPDFNPLPLLSLSPEHLITDLDLKKAVQLTQSLLYGSGGFTCNFPTLAASTLISH